MPVRRSCPFRRCSRPAQVLLCCTLLLLACSSLAFARRAPVLETTPQWVHLSVVWNALTDHSAGLLFSEQRLHRLVPELDRAEKDLALLVEQGALPADTGALLRTVLQERYRYVEEHCYGTSPRAEQTRLDGAEAASHWVVEMQLDLLRHPPAAGSLTAAVQPDGKLEQTVQASLTTELSFLWQCRTARRDLADQRTELDRREAEGGKVDRSRLDVAWARRQQELVEAYQRHRIRPDRGIRRLVPYLIRLTLTPPPAPQLDETAEPPLFPY
jgi:hypothetical protein